MEAFPPAEMPETDDPALAKLYGQRQACVERIGRIAKTIVEYHKAQDFNIELLLNLNQRIREAQSGTDPEN